MAKRIMIVGAGAVGGYVGAHFARDGHDVTFFDAWPEHVSAMRDGGMKIDGVTPEECFETSVRAFNLTEMQSLVREKPFDIVFICVKSYDTAWATTMAKDYLAPDGFVVSLQNCINEETIAGIVGWGRVAGCIAAKIVVELVAPGHVQRNIEKGGEAHTVFRIGEPHGRASRRIEEVWEMLSKIDSAKITTNLWGERWSKLVANSMANGLSAATGLSGNDCKREEATRHLSIRIAGEAVRIGQALGYELEVINKFAPEQWLAATDGNGAVFEEIEASLLESTKKASETARPSMGQDILKGRRTEIDFINGFVVDKGREIGIAAPANAGLAEAVRKVERGLEAPSLDLVKGIA